MIETLYYLTDRIRKDTRPVSYTHLIDIDGALSNPAGLSFLPTDGFRVGVSIQSAFQTRDIDASFSTYNGFDPVNKVPTVSDVPYKKYYKGKAAAPVIPSVFAAYKKGDWTISGFFAITGGGGKACLLYTSYVLGDTYGRNWVRNL